MAVVEDRLSKALAKRQQEGNLRELSASRAAVDFFSNDYLGLARNKELQQMVAKEYDKMSEKLNGSTGSRLLSGNSIYSEELERKLANILRGESALLFNSGYIANLAVFSAIPQKGDAIIYDELIHACIKEGARLSFADRFSFKHNDLNDLESKLKKAKGEKFVAIESVYSMDGDFAPLADLVKLTRQYGAYLILDEAHGTGIFGQGGSGLACDLSVEKDFFIRVCTFGKAMGAHGATVLASETVKQYLINFARSFIYTTALPPHNLVTLNCAFDYLAENIELQSALKKRIDFFKGKIKEVTEVSARINWIESSSAIQAVVVGGNSKAKALSKELIAKGFDVRPILSPTVPEGKERIRICLHAYNSFEEIERLIVAIQSFVY